MNCRFCHSDLTVTMADLATSPPSNSFLNSDSLLSEEKYYPLKVLVCDQCWLAQIGEFKKHSEIFNENYAYFSSYSTSWLKHCEAFVNSITKRLKLNEGSLVIEIASNDGYLLQYFTKKGIQCLGIEPTASTAAEARKKNIETVEAFFTTDLSQSLNSEGRLADLVIGNNVLAHVPDINDFVGGLANTLKPAGTITMEFPHLFNLLHQVQFDTIYHEHFSYLSLLTTNSIFTKHGLKIYDVEEIETHGGSLRIYASHAENNNYTVSTNVKELIEREINYGLNKITIYESFQPKIEIIKNDFLNFLKEKNAKKVVAYGAAAKGNTLLNYCGIKGDLIKFVVDASPYKIGKFLPGSHIPINSEEAIREYRPDYIIILPWNLKSEIMHQLNYVREWGCKFVIAIPKLTIY